MGRKFRRVMIVLVAAVIGIQFIRPSTTNPLEDPGKTVAASIQVPAEVQAIFDRACADCHSDRTRWPWYSHIAPVSWLVARDVEEGREHMNWSRWADYGAYRQQEKLDELCVEIREGEMPLGQYILIHRDAKLSGDEVEVLCAWALAERDRIRKSLDAEEILGAHTDEH